MTTSRLPHVDEAAAAIVPRVLAAPPLLGSTRLVCVDGPAGSGKTTLAAALRRALRDALDGPLPPARTVPVRVVHMDNLYEGWTGLDEGIELLARGVVASLREGRPGRYRRWDWHAGARAEERVVEPGEVLIVEGVGSGAGAVADVVGTLVWVSTPSDVRLDRGLARDGEELRGHWRAFRTQEDAMFTRERTRARADVVVDGRSGFVSWPAS